MDIKELNDKLLATIKSFNTDLNGIQANKVSDTMLKNIIIQFEDGRKLSIISVSTIRVLNNKTLAVKPFDSNDLNIIEKALCKANLNASIGRQNDEIIVTFPDLTKERREELKRMVNEFSVKSKNSVRDLRNKYLTVNKANSKEENIKIEKEIKKYIDNTNKDIDDIKTAKQNDLDKI